MLYPYPQLCIFSKQTAPRVVVIDSSNQSETNLEVRLLLPTPTAPSTTTLASFILLKYLPYFIIFLYQILLPIWFHNIPINRAGLLQYESKNTNKYSEVYINYKQKMEQSMFQFNVLETPDAVKNMTDFFLDGAYSDGVFQKVYSQKFISDLYYYLQNQNNSPKTKFNSLMVLKQIVAKNDLKIVGLLSSSQQFMQFLQKIALGVDPKKPVSQKGKNMFPQDRQGYGNKIVHLVLQILQYLGKKFPKTSKNEPTRFKKILLKLESENVTLPQQFTYFPKAQAQGVNSGNDEKKKGQMDKSKSKQQIEKQQQNERPKDKKQTVNFQALVRFVKYKIDEYMDNLQQIQQVQEMQQLIMKTHQIFKGELAKFDQLGDSIYQSNPAIVQQYLKIRGYIQQQSKIYDNQISKNQFSNYYNQIKFKFEDIFGADPNSNPTPGKEQRKSKIQQKKTKQLKKTDSVMANQNKVQYNSRNSVSNNQNQTRQINRTQSQTNKAIQRRQSKQQPNRLISGLFQKLEDRARSHSGFRQLRESLQKQKKNILAHPPRQRENRDVLKVGRSTLQKSAVKSSIFHNVPNRNPPFKNFQGQLVPSSRQLQNILFDIKKQQGHRRFKVANFRNKYPLFQNDSLQIGFKSQPIFQQYDGFKVFLSIQLYFGNKTNRQIRELEITFQGDQNCLLYTSPRQLPSNLDPQTQLKFGLMVIPQKIPFSFLNMKLFYQTNSSSIRTTVALPTSIIKLSVHTQLQNVQFQQYWQEITRIFKTDFFKLSSHIPPNSIRKYMPNMGQLTNYSQFEKPGSNSDYEVFCLVDIYQNYQAALKITFRTDLNVVIQIGAIEPDSQAVKYIKFYLQTLQMILQETNG